MIRNHAKWLALPTLGLAVALAGQVLTNPAAPAPEGETLYRLHCIDCHGSGMDKPGTVSLATLYESTQPGELVLRDNLAPGFVRAVVRRGIGSMPPFRKTEIDDAQLAKLAEWLAAQGKRKPADAGTRP